MEVLYKFVYNDYAVWEYLNYCTIEPKEVVISDDICKTDEFIGIKYSTPREKWITNKSEQCDEDTYVLNYGNLFATVSHTKFTILVTKDDDKVAIKLYSYYRLRKRGCRFFKIETRVDYITFNTKTNFLYTGFIKNYHKKRKFTKNVRKNEFWSDPVNRVVIQINNKIKEYSKKNVNLNFHKPEIIENVITTFFKNIPQSEKYNNYKPSHRLYKLYCDHYGIKTPNNWDLFVEFYPSIKINVFRKNKMKFIDSFMCQNKLYGDKLKKLLHNTDKIGSFELYRWCITFFGCDFINSKSEDFLSLLIKNDDFISRRHPKSNFSKEEKNNIYEIIRLVSNSFINSITFHDHINMYLQIKKFEEVKWKSKTYEQFKDEHLQYTERVAFYTKGQYTRDYGSEFKNLLEQPILDDYYPVLLESSNDYNLESFVQSNCVKGYVDKASSIIVSLRRGGKNSKERATIEFSVERILGKLKLLRLQNLGRFNQQLSDEWVIPIKILEDKFRLLVNDRIFNFFTCIHKIGYNEYLSGVKFVDSWVDKGLERLVWESDKFSFYDVSPVPQEDIIEF